MKTLIKFVILLTVLGICLPAQADILIYSKTTRSWTAENTGEDDWDIYTDRTKGFLILDVNIPEGRITGIDNAMQIDYGKYGAQRWTDIEFNNIEIERVGNNNNVQYVLTESDFDNGDFRVMMLAGDAVYYNIGLQNRQEIPRQLEGYTLQHDLSDINKMCEVDLRVQQKFTKQANMQGMNFNEAYDMVQDWLRQRGWFYDGTDDNATGKIEGFEKGYLSSPWRTYGDESWFVTSETSKTGNYCARAGGIEDGEISSLELVVDCKQGEISFYKKVSSEQYDYLKFYIDHVEKGRWSGRQDWAQVSFPINAGIRNFRWEYLKDRSVTREDDTAYIDNVVYPSK